MAITCFRDPPCREALIKVAGLAEHSEEVSDALAKLQDLSLITQKDGRYIILSITRNYLQDELNNYTDSNFQEGMKNRWFNWYLKFTKQFGGEDWGSWRSRYDRIEEEWANIESILHTYAALSEWDKVLAIWVNVDGYVDLNRYWQKRRYWWGKIKEKIGDPVLEIKASSERAWTSILMGAEHYADAEKCLREAWKFRKAAAADKLMQADIANHLAILEKVQKNYSEAQKWLDQEAKLIKTCKIDKRIQTRHISQNLYYQAEINYLTGEFDLAKTQLEKVIELCKEIGWQRFLNYAQNSLAEILIQKSNLEAAEELLLTGLYFAESMREKRRIALYQASYARFYHQLSNIADAEERHGHLSKAKDYAEKALKVFQEEWMSIEQEEIENLIGEIVSPATDSS